MKEESWRRLQGRPIPRSAFLPFPCKDLWSRHRLSESFKIQVDHNLVSERIDWVDETVDVLVFPFSKVVYFIAPEPRRSPSNGLYTFFLNVITNALRHRLLANSFLLISGQVTSSIVIHQELMSTTKTCPGNLRHVELHSPPSLSIGLSNDDRHSSDSKRINNNSSSDFELVPAIQSVNAAVSGCEPVRPESEKRESTVLANSPEDMLAFHDNESYSN